MHTFEKTSRNILLGTLVVYLVLVASNNNNFWPFASVHTSQSELSWSNALVRDISSIPDSIRWQKTNIDNLPGIPIALNDFDVTPSHLNELVAKIESQSQKLKSKQSILQIFDKSLKNRELLIFQVVGKIKNDSVVVEATPKLLIKNDSLFTYKDFKTH